jgi:hypothetical protein
LERVRATIICHIEMVGELAALRAVVTSAAELVLGHSPNESFLVEIVDELVAQFCKLDELCSRHEDLRRAPLTATRLGLMGRPSRRGRRTVGGGANFMTAGGR